MPFRKIAAVMLCMAMLPGATPLCDVQIGIAELRSSKGLLQLCLTRNQNHFPDCEDDPAAMRLTVPASSPEVRFRGVPAGQYALAVVHDENGNARLDTFAGIPREGVGFSRNPSFTFGPPKFDKVLFDASIGAPSQKVRIKYFL